jgi:hypothetical protein
MAWPFCLLVFSLYLSVRTGRAVVLFVAKGPGPDAFGTPYYVSTASLRVL